MIGIRGGLRRSNTQRDGASGACNGCLPRAARERRYGAARLMTLRFCAPTVAALTLAFAANALGAPAAAASSSASVGHPGSSASPGSSTGDRAANAILLVPGTGYRSPNGSMLVRVLQQRLAAAGFPAGPIDGRYGPLTSAATVDFQSSHALQVDGIAGPQTWAALSPATLVLTPGAGDEPGGAELVRALQRDLASAGFAPGPIDGRYGPLTQHAVRRFQAARGLRVSGTAGPQTLALLPKSAAPVNSSEAVARVNSSKSAAPVHTSQPPSPGLGSPAFHAYGQPVRSRARTNLGQSAHRTSGPSTGWIGGLIALGLALILVAAWFWRRRRGGRAAPAPQPVVDPRQSAPLEHPASVVATLNGGDATPAGQVVSDANESEGPGHPTGLVEPSDHHDVVAQLPDEDDSESGRHLAAAANNNHNGHRECAAAEDIVAAAAVAEVAEEVVTDSEGSEQPGADADRRDDAGSAFSLGLLLEERGNRAEARAAYRRADECGHAAAASNLGVLLEEQGDSAEAEAAYRRADQRGDATGAFNLGVLLEERGAVEDADEAYRRADARGNGEVSKIARAALLDLREGMDAANGTRAASGHHDGDG